MHNMKHFAQEKLVALKAYTKTCCVEEPYLRGWEGIKKILLLWGGGHTCIKCTHVYSIHMYTVHTCTQYTYVHSIHMYTVLTCTPWTHAHSKHTY